MLIGWLLVDNRAEKNAKYINTKILKCLLIGWLLIYNRRPKSAKYEIQNIQILALCWLLVYNRLLSSSKGKTQNTKIQKYPNTCLLVGCWSTIDGRHHENTKYKIIKYQNIEIPARWWVVGLQ